MNDVLQREQREREIKEKNMLMQCEYIHSCNEMLKHIGKQQCMLKNSHQCIFATYHCSIARVCVCVGGCAWHALIEYVPGLLINLHINQMCAFACECVFAWIHRNNKKTCLIHTASWKIKCTIPRVLSTPCKGFSVISV